MLADVGGHNGLPAGQPVEQVTDILVADATIPLPVAERILLPPLLNLFPPRLNLRGTHQRYERSQHPPGVADDGNVRRLVLPNLGRVDVDMDETGVGGKIL